MEFNNNKNLKKNQSTLYVTDPEVKKQVETLTNSLNTLIVQFIELKEKVDDYDSAIITEALTSTIANISQITGTTAFFDVFNGKKFAFSSNGEEASRIVIAPGTVIYAEYENDYILSIWGGGSLFFCVANTEQKWNIMEDGDLVHSSGNVFKYWTIGGGASETTGTAVIGKKLSAGVTAEGNFNATFSDLSIANNFEVLYQANIKTLTVTDVINGTSQNAVNASNDGSGNSIADTYETIENVNELRELVPDQATSENQLADKNFVNSSISSNTATFFGNFNTYALFQSAWGTGETNNDYAIVTADETHNNEMSRYKFNGITWLYEYKVNDTPLTAVQLAAVNSGVTQSIVAKVEGIETGAEVNVQADWEEIDSTSDSFIKNKPGLATTTTAGLMSASDKQIVNQMSEGGVTGVKGDKEPSYRTGNVNIQLSDITGVDAEPTEDSDNVVKSGAIWAMFNAVYPIGYVYTQFPGCDDPITLGMLGTWERYYTGGCFLRGEGGGAKPFSNPIGVTSISGVSITLQNVTGISAGDLLIGGEEYRTITAINGTTITVDNAFNNSEITTVLIGQNDQFQGHSHKIQYQDNANVGGGGAARALRNELPYNQNSGVLIYDVISDGTNGTPRTGSETRTKNITVRYWKRTA